MKTERLIEHLAGDAQPVRPLASPGRRLGHWLAIGVPAMAVAVLIARPRPDLAQKFLEAAWLIEQGAALLTALLAAYAAFSLVVPGRSGRVAWLPAAPFLVWLGTLGIGCLRSWLARDAASLAFEPELECLPSIVAVGAVPCLVIYGMVKSCAPLKPGLTLALAALAAAALGNVGHSMTHEQNAGLMVLVWHFGSVAALAGLGWGLGRLLLTWRTVRPA
jgi:hypothetical protein